jgi:pimeloyl-ACP methyl ester carboxylesterase
MSLKIPRTRWRGLARNGLLFVLGLGTVSALTEHILERRDAARLTATDTFYVAHERRIRYHLTSPRKPGPTVVLLNGMTATFEQWEGVQNALSTVSPVLAYDRGGAGFSDPTDTRDANGEADELDQLLHSSEISGPFVLVSYSSSSMMATVFAAKHPDVVKGIVFVDPAPVGRPALPAPATKTYRRVFWRFNVVAIQAFFGYTRLRLNMEGRSALPSSRASERYDAAIRSTHHWLASAHEAMSLDESVDESDAAMATRPFAHVPLGLLSSLDPTSEYLHALFERQRKLVASSDDGLMRAVHLDHNQLLNDPVSIGAIVDLVRTIVGEVRSKAAADAASGPRETLNHQMLVSAESSARQGFLLPAGKDDASSAQQCVGAERRQNHQTRENGHRIAP